MMMGHQRQMFAIEARKPKAPLETLAPLAMYFNGHWHSMVIVAILVLVTTAMQVVTPALTGQLVDCYLSPATQKISGADASARPVINCWLANPSSLLTTQDYVNGMGGLILVVVVLFVLSSVLTGLQFFLMNYVGFRVLRNMRVVIFEHIHRLSLGY